MFCALLCFTVRLPLFGGALLNKDTCFLLVTSVRSSVLKVVLENLNDS